MSDFPLIIDLDEAVPVYAQIERQIRALVKTGNWGPGDRIPSVRETAARLRINPLTVQKAYRNLQDAGMLESRPGAGVYVSKSARPRRGRRDDVRRELARVVEESGLPPPELRELFEEALQCSRSRSSRSRGRPRSADSRWR